MTGMIISDTYLSQADHLTNPDGRSLIILNMHLIDGFLGNFLTNTFRKRRGAKIRRKLIPHFFDVRYAAKEGAS
jgi:hypothetical protein